MSFLPSTTRSLLRSSRSVTPSSASSFRSSPSSSFIRSISSASSSSSTSSSTSIRSTQYLTLTLATLGLTSALLSSSSPIRLDDEGSNQNTKRKSYHERMKAEHKQAPIPTFAREKQEELQETEEEQDGEEESQGQEAAFDPSTGQINWDCPCLGGMADGPCGPQFKEAFSCFVFSEEEPKGIECVDKFKHMQDCFRQYPEVYKEELEDEERGLEEERLEMEKQNGDESAQSSKEDKE